MNPLLAGISIDPAICFGKPCIRGHRFTVAQVLAELAQGMHCGRTGCGL